jgi:hypothetical protein
MKLMMEIVLAGVWLIVVGVWVWSGWRFLPEADRLIKAWVAEHPDEARGMSARMRTGLGGSDKLIYRWAFWVAGGMVVGCVATVFLVAAIATRR